MEIDNENLATKHGVLLTEWFNIRWTLSMFHLLF